MATATPSTQVIKIPERPDPISTDISPPDLYACVQVSRLWQQAFTPRSIDNASYSWPIFLKNHRQVGILGDNDTEEGWIRMIFKKYGGMIEHFTVWSKEVLEAAYASGACTRLKSLELSHCKRPYEKGQYKDGVEYDEDGDEELGTNTGQQQQQRLYLSPIFESDTLVMRLPPKQEYQQSQQNQITSQTQQRRNHQDRLSAQHFWLLLRNSNATLQSLRIHIHVSRSRIMSMASHEFIYDSLGMLNNLREFEYSNVGGLQYGDARFESLYPVMIPDRPKTSSSGEGTVGAVAPLPLPRPSALVLESTYQNLRVLETGSMAINLLASCFQYLSTLETLMIESVHRNSPESEDEAQQNLSPCSTAENATPYKLWNWRAGDGDSGTVGKYCPQLERFEVPRMNEMESIALEPGWTPLRIGVVDVLLRKCPRLRVLDAINRAIDADWLTGVPPTYLRYERPITNTLELTLGSGGLERLAGLKRLEVFGFEGVDHRIGEKELSWMVENWPRL
ncbi:MAG: hypothetical protein J3R72DRAFT_491393 [Linnemannia gamsii]|nr:MAG: hypothetical protein J3R72DRAFT_491393 [Linnemannia gamsii]